MNVISFAESYNHENFYITVLDCCQTITVQRQCEICKIIVLNINKTCKVVCVRSQLTRESIIKGCIYQNITVESDYTFNRNTYVLTIKKTFNNIVIARVIMAFAIEIDKKFIE